MSERSNPRPHLPLVDQQLRSQAPSACVPPPADLAQRVLRAIDSRRAAGPTVPEPRRLDRSYLSAAALLLLVGTLAVTLCSPGPARGPLAAAPTLPDPAARAPSRAPRDMELVIAIDTSRYASLVKDRTGHLATAFESPLFDQARRLVSEARHAVDTVLARIPAPVRIEAHAGTAGSTM